MTVTIREPATLSQEDVERYAGKWVAIKDGKVLFSSDDPENVVQWVESQGISPDIVRQLPTGPEPEVWVL